MLWLAVLGLFAAVIWLFTLTGDLKARLTLAEQRLGRLTKQFEENLAAGAPVAKPRSKAPLAAPAPTNPKPAPDPGPWVRPAPAIAQAAASGPKVAAPPARPRGPTREQAAAWLSENGLAWLGGGVLGLGGIFMVAYAAQRGVFSPPFRIAAAVGLGLVLVGVSEALLRQAKHGPGGNRLAAAVAAGAGATTIYAAVWASYWLYSFIGLGPAGALLGVVSLGLLALSMRHGEPLAMLAVGGALLAPAVTGPQHWDAPALTAYLSLVAATGYAVSGARRWGLTGMTTLAGAVLWALAGFAAEGYLRVAALAVGPLALAIAAAEWRRRRADDAPAKPDSFGLSPVVALIAAAILLAGLWSVRLQGPDLAPAALAEGALLILAIFGVRRGLVPAGLQLAAYASMLAVAFACLAPMPPAGLELWGAGLAVTAATCGVWAAFAARSEPHGLLAAGGAVAALILSLSLRGPITAQAPLAGPAGGALLLGVCSILVARRVDSPARSIPLALWIWSGAAALLMALRLASPPELLPLTLAMTAPVFAVLHVRLGWRGFAGAAIAGGLASLAALLNPDLLRPMFASHAWPITAVAFAAVAAAVVAGASRLIRDQEAKAPAADSLATAAILIALTGVMLLLRFWGAKGGGGWRLDPFAESGLRSLTILAAGLLSTMAVRGDSHPIARWRGHVLLGLGLAHAVLLQGLIFNPLWAWWTPAVSGPPLADSLALGFLAPALLFALAASRRVTTERRLTAVYAAAGFGFGLLWAVVEIRRLFQSASLHLGIDTVGRAEAAAYALLGLVVARALFAAAAQAQRRGWGLGEVVVGVRRLAVIAAWIALIFAAVGYGDLASPWWGPITRPLASQAHAGLLFSLYAAGVATALWLVRAAEAEGAGPRPLARAGRLATVLIAFALINLLVRWGFRGLDMRPVLQKASFETWAFSAVWGLYGFGLLIFATARREADLRWAGLAVLLGTTAKVFLFDMAQLEGIVRAASFLAVGGLLLAAAVIARRLAAPNPPAA